MKQFILLFLAIPFLSFTPKTDPSQFIGKWTGEDKGKVGQIEFTQDGYAAFTIEGKIFGGPSFEMRGSKAKMTYEINTAVSPAQVDFIIELLDSDKPSKKLLGIAKFINKNNMKLALSFDGAKGRPTSFTKKNSILLTRKK